MKRLIALLLAALMLLGLAACGGNGETAQTDTALADDGEAYNGEMPIVKPGDEPITLTIGLQTNGNVTDYKDNDYTKWLEEQTGLNLEFVQFSGTNKDIATQVALMIAGGETLPDILKPGSGVTKIMGDEYGLDGYFIDLKPYFEKYAYHHKAAFERLFPDDPKVREFMMLCAEEPSTGKIFGYPKLEYSNTDRPICHMWINQTWLDRLGLERPTTLQELHDVLVAFRDKDPNGNGKKDEIPMIGKANSGWDDPLRPIINAFIYWHSSYDFSVDESGKIGTPYDQDEYRQALIYASDLVKEGLLSPLTWTQTSSELKNMFNPDSRDEELCGVLCGHLTVKLNPNSPAMYDYETVAPFKAETPKGGYAPIRSYAYSFNAFITADCKHPVEAFKFLDFLSTEEGFLRGRYGVPGRDWVEVPDAEPADERGGMAFRVLGDGVLSSQNNITWHGNWGVADYTYYHILNEDEWALERSRRSTENYKNYYAVGQPEKTFVFGIYSREEQETRTEIEKDLQEYIKDRRAQFCTGLMDPRSDADWQAYLEGRKSLRYDEWVALAQTADDRLPEKFK